MPRPRNSHLSYTRGTRVAATTDPVGKRVRIRAAHAPGNEGLPAYMVLGQEGTIISTRHSRSIIEVQLDRDPPGTTWYFPAGDVRVLPEPPTTRRRAVHPYDPDAPASAMFGDSCMDVFTDLDAYIDSLEPDSVATAAFEAWTTWQEESGVMALLPSMRAADYEKAALAAGEIRNRFRPIRSDESPF